MTGGLVPPGILSAAFALFMVQTTVAGAQVPAGDPSAPKFRSSVDVVSVAAVVRDRKGRFVKDLSKQDFQIIEAGKPRPIIDFRAELNGPVKLAVLLDISGSMRVGQRTAEARQAAGHIFSTLDAHDEAAVYTFDTALVQSQTFTSDRAKLERAVESSEKPFGQTSLYDAIARTAEAVAEQSKSGPRGLPHRSAVVVITDGIDTRSNLKPGDVAVIASGVDVPVYIVAVVATVDDPRESNHERTAQVASDLQELARGTGGELFIASAPAHASTAARQLVDELRHQYVLAFEASSVKGWRPLEVRMKENGLTVRARTGYTGSRTSSEEAAAAAISRTSQRPLHVSGR